MRGALLSLGLALCACSAGKVGPAHAPHEGQGRPEPVWLTHLDAEHPLVGRLWDVRARAFVPRERLVQKLAGARFVLLGERHDNPDHHRLQASLLQELVRAGRRPAVVFEMLEQEQQQEIDAYLKSPQASAAGFGAAVGWEKSGWPAYAMYQPIFEVALGEKLPIVAGNLARAAVRGLVHHGLSLLPPERVAALKLDQPFPEALEAPLLDELRASHCGQLPEEMLAPMALAQHARDAALAEALGTAAGADGAVLIAGSGHVRRERAVPYYLALQAPGATSLSLAIEEVAHDKAAPAEYGPVESDGFDYVWFTPRASDEDPCASFHSR